MKSECSIIPMPMLALSRIELNKRHGSNHLAPCSSVGPTHATVNAKRREDNTEAHTDELALNYGDVTPTIPKTRPNPMVLGR